ncbi:hypothetical protein HNR48_000667 [Pseudoteredinibacter isoporae]|uniref:Uncharacterized protein n=1 Tax=Pseudoteredinibacter isoporae TaxID=570281 RepID=A0A7X0JQE7_9GAMM|nr:hypothetical protein [Pseudoteredinibacter isoporae]
MGWLKKFAFIILGFGALLVGIWHLYLEDYQKHRILQGADRLMASQHATNEH